MLKLAIIAGISLTALLCGMMALGGSNGLFQGGNNRNFDFLNDIKEVFGFPPKSQNQATSNRGNAPTSFSFGSSGSGDGGYLPPKSSNNDGSYLPPKSFAEDDSNYTDFTTPLFRIFVLSTTTSTVPTTTGNPPSEATSTTATTTSTTTSAVSPITPTTFNPSINATESTSNSPAFKEEALAEATTVASVSPSSPTGYAFQGNPSPQFKVDLIWSTLVPPSISNAENEVAMSASPKSSSDNAGTGGYGGGSPPNNGLYLPPNKEYLPPSSQ